MGLLDALAARPRLAVVAGALAIAFSGLFYRWSGVSPATGVVFRSLYGLPILVLVAAAESRRLGPMTRRTWLISALAGAFFAGDILTYHTVVNMIGAGLATVMGNTQVVVVAFAAWLVFGERPRREIVGALPLVLIGVVLISGVIGGRAYGSDPTLGVLIGCTTAMFYAGYLLIIRQASPDHRPVGPVAISSASTAVCAIAVGAMTGSLDLVPSVPAHVYLVLYGVISQSIGYVVIQASLPKLPSALSSILLLVQPVAAVGLAFLLLGEDPSPVQIGGIALVILGVSLATGALGRLRTAVRHRVNSQTG